MIMSFLFGCSHARYSWPMRSKGNRFPHVCCLECGTEARYDLEHMRPIWKQEHKPIKPQTVKEVIKGASL